MILNKTESTEVSRERYHLKRSLLTDTEKEFLKVLESLVEDRYHIELQVQLSHIVAPFKEKGHFVNYGDFNKIKAKSIDFVLYDKDYKPYLAIELDDYTHLRHNRIERDNFVDEVMKGVGLRILHIPVSYSYDMTQLGKEIM